jgi:hypothetical protein
MKLYRGTLLASAILITALPLFGCGNALEGGSNPSGSYLRVTTVTPDKFEPDIFLTVCAVNTTTGELTYETGITNTYASVTLKNESAPNTPTGESTNSYVTMQRYRVDFVGTNMTVSIPSIDGAGQTVGIPADGIGSMTVVVMDLATLEYIRSHYSSVGNGETLNLRAKVTMWGVDAFQVPVQAEVQLTLIVDEYDRC